jgi:hypothetical protein
MVLHGNKVKVLLSLCLINHYAINRYEGVEVQLHIFLTLAPSSLGVKVFDTHLIRVLVGPTVRLDTVMKRETSATAGNQTPSLWSSSPSLLSIATKPRLSSLHRDRNTNKH